MRRIVNQQIKEMKEQIIKYYGDRLTSLVIYGSLARGVATSQSDIDLLLIIKKLHRRKMKRIEEFIHNVKDKLESISCYISPIIKTPDEASRGSPLFLDMVYDSVILYDQDDFFKNILERLQKRLEELGSKRVFIGNRWYWILKPDLKLGEVFEV